MKVCKITVLKTGFNQELVDEYGVKGFTKCPLHKEGDVFYGHWAKPEGFCDEAWKSISHYAEVLSYVPEGFKFPAWVDVEGTTICCCPDGLRPVIFKLEQAEMP